MQLSFVKAAKIIHKNNDKTISIQKKYREKLDMISEKVVKLILTNSLHCQASVRT